MSEIKRRWKVWVGAVIALLVLGTIPLAYVSTEEGEDQGMGLLLAEKVCLASAFEGVITANGEPASGAQVTRVYEFKNKEHRESVTTDANGRFAFDSVWDKQRGFIVQFVSHQEIYVDYREKQFHIWTGAKLDEAEFWEFGGTPPENLRCELGEQIRRVDLKPAGFIGTSCHWD